MLQNARVTAFFVSKLLRENQQWGKGKITSTVNLALHKDLLLKTPKREVRLH